MTNISLINWTAKRAGGRITVYGVDQSTGKPLKVPGVDKIEPSNGNIYAVHMSGAIYHLSTSVHLK